jgi:hypothetical protein
MTSTGNSKIIVKMGVPLRENFGLSLNKELSLSLLIVAVSVFPFLPSWIFVFAFCTSCALIFGLKLGLACFAHYGNHHGEGA